ncbi:hypothetical protein G7B40_015055 [Aetokthonos hydrillicola Thurmond2011]|jgi:hypothetical protein|uniref:Uncharacterized protein n=1 Tax=Aetokthonos hydrillicola Thurmond2011 TaxID=2712845 RepID=A0AAP5I962_9CYAN|nr:hypothetical protein [Aetokthonos hydrillicola]MBO3461887.1 hypothetical protein [Aetokthonos hydrillicola CCALA 1050]MBW4586771.1 hypothetical protein [Aetokthonos hydrillicola CCALA 1050]MDR9895872.1 hypothetical protein [Aetokthonos hydrillicola Thurmond2011]
MTVYSQTLFIATGPLPNPETLRTEQPSESKVKDDPLIAKGWETSVYVGSVFVVLGVLVVVGIFSQKFEHVVTMALILTAILIACFLVMSL